MVGAGIAGSFYGWTVSEVTGGVEKLWETCGQTRPAPLDWLLGFRNDVASGCLSVSNYTERTNDIVRAVHLLRQHGMAVGFPMQTADGEIIFPVDKNFTLTAEQILELRERGELDAEGVRRSVEAQAATPMRRRAASFLALRGYSTPASP